MGTKKEIERLVEDRRAEATKKQLPSKFKYIVKVLGFPVRDSAGVEMMGEAFWYSTSSDHYNLRNEEQYEDDDNEEILPTDENLEKSTILAYHFDGVTNGINLQIHYQDASLVVHFEGTEVYRESRGVIECYVPSDKWESKVDLLFDVSKKKGKIIEEIEESQKKESNERRSNFVLDKLQKLWGIGSHLTKG